MVFHCMNPAHTNRIDREMDRLLSTFFGGGPAESPNRGTPAANVWESGEAWVVEMELPGVAADQLDISVVNDELTVSAKPTEGEVEGATYYRRERPRGSFSRALRLPAPVDSQGVEARLVHGVLTVTLPKAEAARRRKIEVKA